MVGVLDKIVKVRVRGLLLTNENLFSTVLSLFVSSAVDF